MHRRRLTQVASHYGGGVRAVYDTAPFYAPGPYEAWLLAACRERLALTSTQTLADIGGGSGAFAAKLKQATDARWLSVVEPSAEMLAGAKSDPAVDLALCAGALEWAQEDHVEGDGSTAPIRYDRVLLKEVVHHFEASDRPRLFSELRTRRLADSGRVLIVTRPQRNIDYPLWEAAREVWADNQPSEAKLIDELRAAGFVHVECHTHTYPHVVPVDEWCRLVRGRFWSTFANFSEEELERGCQQICDAATRRSPPADASDEKLQFEDRLLLIVASLPASPPASPPSSP